MNTFYNKLKIKLFKNLSGWWAKEGKAKGKVPIGIYCTPKLDVALGYTDKQVIDGYKVQAIF